MYKEIEELVNAISKEKVLKDYLKANHAINDIKMKMFLSRHQSLQEEYLRMKRFDKPVLCQTLKDGLLVMKKEMALEPVIQQYYQKYYDFNDVLDEITKIVFNGISEEVKMDQFTL